MGACPFVCVVFFYFRFRLFSRNELRVTLSCRLTQGSRKLFYGWDYIQEEAELI